ncbi:MAG: tetratricopeptide repeat protein [Verrucomicrobiota bacterium]|jgi:tetratricopeptide (TPR) repeat protein
MRRTLCICLLLAGVTLAIYWPVWHYGLVNYDDPLFVTVNPEINRGLTWHSVGWALSGVLVGNWHPVTSLSFVLTHQLFGIDPGAEHAVNIVFHAANAVLLFLVLQRMTKSPWRSAVVAALFAWHPLRVESVAWIAERKDVLCGFFFLLTLFCYAKAVTSAGWQVTRTETAPGSSLDTRHPSLCYWLALLFFALALMSKPMAVTLPFVLLLLDVWPLRRISEFGFRSSELKNTVRPSTFNSQLKTLVLEKWPFFPLAVVVSGLTYWVQKSPAAGSSLANPGLADRICNVISSYVQYPAKLLWPTKLAVIYPFPKSYDILEITLAALLLLAISALCVCQLFRRPYLAVGWFWYLGTLVPIIGLVQQNEWRVAVPVADPGTAVPLIGLVQVGEQAMADRYTYLPLIGPVISLVWLVAELFHSRKILLAGAATLVLAGCAALTGRQLQFWRNGIILFEHTIAVTTDNPAAQFRLGTALEREGRLHEAMLHYLIAMKMNPLDYRIHYCLANCLERAGRWDAAVTEYEAGISLGANPDDYVMHLNFAAALSHLGRAPEAVYQLNEALRVKPDSSEAMNNLAWLLATCPDANVRDGARAVQLAGRACELTDYRKTMYVGTLAAAYAEAGRFDDAMATAQKACALASQSGEQELLQKNRELLALYLKHQPYREFTGSDQPTTNCPPDNIEKLVPDAR